jgi:23S rRNA (uracil1939-C5)-methyltransferase
VAAPLMMKAVQALQSIAVRGDTLLEISDELELFCNAEESELQTSFFTTQNAEISTQNFTALCEELKKMLPQLTGAGLYKQPQPENSRRKVIAQPIEIARWGLDELTYTIGTTGYRVCRGAFFQVNRGLLASLRNLVTAGRSGKLAWDLYAGVGLFSVPLAENFSRVVAVESAAPATHDLAYNLIGTQHQIKAATTLNFLRTQQTSARPDLIVLDPPRAGLGPEVCKLLGEIVAPELVYVSCDPATLSRDLAALVEFGYQLVHLHLFDLFPQTFHLETVAVLTCEA